MHITEVNEILEKVSKGELTAEDAQKILGTYKDEELGKEYIGFENLLEYKELRKAIGWNFLQQLNSFSMGFYRRAKRKLSDIS